VFDNAQLFVTAFTDVSQRNTYGVFAGISFPIGGGATLSTGATSSASGTSITTDASRPLALEPGSYGWRIRDSEGASGYRSAAGSYRSSVATVQAGVEQSNGGVRGIGQVEGAISALSSGIFLSNRIDDSFAVVETGVAGVPVMYENRPAGETDRNGKLLIPNLRAYGKNKISIDPKNLPVNAEVDQVEEVVSPADRSGIVVKMGAKTDVHAAVVILVGAEGKPLPVGSTGQLQGGTEPFVVGYDGRAFVKELKAANTVVVTTEKGECRASFDYQAETDRQVVVGPTKCQ
jgi:outer membrane usher protein